MADLVIQALRSAVAPLVKRLDEVDLLIKTMPETLAPGIEQTVRKAVDALPPAKDGKDFPPEEVQRMVAEAVSALPPARDGADGQSVTAEDLAPLVAEEVTKAVALIPKPKDGESIPPDQVRRMVDEEVAKAVSALPPPKDGEAGRDALQLELQPAIDLEKSYPRGTYARHAGGLWRAFEATKGLHGWECIVDGIAELRIEQPSGREFMLVARTSSGAEVSKSIKVAALVDKGVFRAEESYEAGDGVTWGGSFFIAQKDAPIGKPGEPGCDGWRLAVKRGRDAGKAVQL
ncbi:phage portal protein [uncultured Variovorax sp.]|uniref:phage portal protein n=1 Tax=uncultured Variovorax sp. TaxID=114708 RepID=UPI0025FCD0F3|nr:phage portal protein [uncultured Variovorax sp.]